MQSKPRQRFRGLALGAMVVSIVLFAAACGSDKSKGGGATFNGTWTLAKAEPPVAAGRGGRGGPGGGGIAGPYADTLFAQAPAAVTITQTGSAMSARNARSSD